MKFRIVTLFIFSCFIASAQEEGFAIINDQKGYIDLKLNETTDSIITKLFEGDIFICELENDSDDWANAVYTPEVSEMSLKEKKYYSKFIHFKNKSDSLNESCWVEGAIERNKFSWLADFPEIRDTLIWTKYNHDLENRIYNDSITIAISQIPFDSNQHKIQRQLDGDLSWISKIDNEEIIGRDGDMPVMQLNSLQVTYHNKKVNIPQSAYTNIFEPDIRAGFFAVYGKNGYIYLLLSGSDGAAAYQIVWVIKNGKYIKRYIDTIED